MRTRTGIVPGHRGPSATSPNEDALGRGPTTGWWVGAVGYQVYLRSFLDGDGDGIGDLAGLRRGLAHIASLGVDYLWITPFYPSPQADHGYDIADHLDVDPTFGTLAELDACIDDAHARGLRVVIDIVPNHTSDQHPWFRDALTGRDARFRDHYVWRDPAPDGGPPNNWVSKFGGPAWTYDAASGQYYMHTFLPEQPDLDWANPAVREAFDRIVRFWVDRGVDGLRIDTAHLLTTDRHLRDNPLRRPIPDDADADTAYHCYDHRYDLDQPDVLDVYRRWQELTSEDGTLLLGEVGLFEPAPVGRYVRDGALDLAFYFPALKTTWDPAAIRRTLVDGVAASSGRFCWPLSSHDDPRAAQRFADGGNGAERALAYLTLLAGLPGGVMLLQGDELGLDTTDLPATALQDPVATRAPGAVGRDLSRTPVPWDAGPGHGFTSGRAWLPVPSDTTRDHTVASQEADPGSRLHRTRDLLQARRRLTDLTGELAVAWPPTDPDVVAYRRGTTIVALNTAGTPRRLDGLPASARLAYRSDGGSLAADPADVPSETATVVVAAVDPA